MAEAERFELSVGYEPTPVFKTGAFNRSAKLPMRRIIDEFFVNARIFYKNWHNFVIFKHQLPMGRLWKLKSSIKAKLKELSK